MSNRPSRDRGVPGLLTWGCGCAQDPLAPVGEFTFRCDQHPIELRYCPICDQIVEKWIWTPERATIPCLYKLAHPFHRHRS